MNRLLMHWFGRTPKPAQVRRRVRPSLELLEDRTVPAVFKVTTLLDTVDADPNVTSLREAIQAANFYTGNDSITFAAGLTGTINLASALPDLSSNMAIWGPGPDLLTVRRDTGGNYRIFTVTAATTVTLAGLTVSNGYISTATDYGGGISNSGTLTVSNSTFFGNYAVLGGGIYNDGTLTLNDSMVSTNHGRDGGGGIENWGTMTVNNCTVSANHTVYGGGIENWPGGTLTVSNSVISGNSADDDGGGINHSGTLLTLVGSTLSANSADRDGGGLYNGSPLTVINSTFSVNVAGADGGGLFIADNATLTNVTVTANRAIGVGGGIRREIGTLTLRNTLVAGNFKGSGTSRDDVSAAVTADSSYNLIGDGTGLTSIVNGINGNLIGSAAAPIDPRLGPLANNGGPTLTHALLTGSPALDRGAYFGAPAADQRGVGRFGAPDIGAFELPAPLGFAQVVKVTSMVRLTKTPLTLTATGRLRQKVTLGNKTGQRIQGPISLVLDKLTVGARLWKPTGKTKVWKPLKSFYLDRLPGDGILDPGEKLTFVLEFVVPPGTTAIKYKVRVLAGKGPR